MNNFIGTYFLPFNVHPLFIATLAFIAGIIIGLPFIYASMLLCAGFVTLFLIFYGKHYAKKMYLLATISIIICAFGSIRLHYARHQFDEFHQQTDQGVFTAKGSITNIERVDNPRFDQCITLDTYNLARAGKDKNIQIPHKTTLQLYTKRTKDLLVGDVVSFENLLFRSNKQSGFQDYLLKEGIAASLFVESLSYSLVSRPAYSFTRFIFYQGQNSYNALQKTMNPTTFRLFSLIFLGKKLINKQPTERIKQHFNTWGVTHYLARSGLHMVIFAFIWYMILNILPFHVRYKQVILLVLSMIYYLLSWQSISFYRAFIQFLLYKFCIFFLANSHVLHILTITCLGVLLNNPLQLFFLDFQLSFGLTFALAWFNHLQNQRYKRQSHQNIASAEAGPL